MFKSLFGKKKEPVKVQTPTVMGLRLGGSFEIDSLLLKLEVGQFVAQGITPTQIIKSVGLVDLDGTWLFRFYTDDDAFLQVVTEGGQGEEDVVDVKLFHFYDTQDISSERVWNELLKRKIGRPTYDLEGRTFERVWTSADDYHNPVLMVEKTYEADGSFSETDQFTMLFDRPVGEEQVETLFLSAEETEDENQNISRCLVISTGLSLSAAQITIHG